MGIGHYFLDIHRCDVGCERKRDINFKHVQLSDGSWAGENSSGRFQIPFGALVPAGTDGFMAGAKNIETEVFSIRYGTAKEIDRQKKDREAARRAGARRAADPLTEL